MKKGLSKLVFIVDRSGSMGVIASEMEEAIEQVLDEQKDSIRGELVVTFVRFDSVYEEVFNNKPIAEVDEIKLEPRGNTALLDAIGKTVNKVEREFSEANEDERPEKVLFIVITDGQENNSKEFSKEDIFSLIEKCERDHKWDFTFVGAKQDAIKEGAKYGFRAKKSITYCASADGTRGVGEAMSKYTKQFMEDGGIDAAYSDEDRDKAMGEDVSS